MIKRYTQRRENKCNFCFQWFNSESTLKNSIHICNPCLDKALKTNCYRVPSPDGKQIYQIYFFKNNLKISGENLDEDCFNQFKNNLIQNIDDFRNQELKKLIQKWKQITLQINKFTKFDAIQMNKYTNILRQSLKKYPTAKQVLQQKQAHHQNKNADLGTPTEIYMKNNIKNDQKLKSINVQAYNIYNSPNRRPLRQMVNSPNKQIIKISDFGRNFKPPKPQQNKIGNKHGKTPKLSQTSFSSQQSQVQIDRRRTLVKSPSKDSLLSLNQRKNKEQPYTKQKREKDLLIVSQDALKSKIYNYLQTQSAVAPGLFLSMTFQIYDAIQNTSCLNKCIELVAHNVQQIDIKCYLSMLQWTGVDVLKLVKVGLNDEQFKAVLDFIKDKKIQTLVASSNKLTEQSVIEFKQACKNFLWMRNLYLGMNRIQKLKVKDQIKQIQNKISLFI